MFTDLSVFIRAAGLLGIFAVVFAESGLLVGFFLPGDSLLVTAGLLAAQGYFNISLLLLGAFIAAVAGDSTGYAIGRRLGPALFSRPRSFFFNPENVLRARRFYDAHGGKTIVLARFMPFIRTFAPVVAGIAGMRYGAFLFYNLAGGFLWAAGLTALGYTLGEAIPDVDRYLLPIIGGIIFLSILPILARALKRPGEARKAWRNFWNRK